MVEDARHWVSVAAVVVDEAGAVLAIRRRDTGRWEPPGGVLELGEPIHAGLVREVWEETRVEVEPGALTGVYKNVDHGVLNLVFRARMVGGTPGPTEEATEVTWLPAPEVARRMAAKHARRVQDALDALLGAGPVVCTHGEPVPGDGMASAGWSRLRG